MSRRTNGLGFAFLLVSTVAALAVACSDDDPTRPTPADANEAPGGDGERDDGPRPDDDPTIGAQTVDSPDGAAEAETGSGSGTSVPSGGTCVAGGVYCGGDKVIGATDTLYKCNGPGTPTVVEKCAAGCMVNPGSDDACNTPAGAHVPSPVPGKVVTYPFGVKNASYAAGYHTGEDYATATGSNAVAVRNGTIRWSNDNGGAYGKWMGLDADNGRTYVYCHLSSRLLAAGTKVVAGQVIAKTGATGNVTGPHLHFEDHPLGPFVYAQVRKPAW